MASPRPEAKRAVVLLTDGRQDAEPQAALDAATALWRAGIDLLAVGLGVDADLPFLEQLVVDKGKVRRAADESTLVEVCRQLARELPCDRAMWWGATGNTIDLASGETIEIAAYANLLGAEGWELVSVVPNTYSGTWRAPFPGFTLWFKRPRRSG